MNTVFTEKAPAAIGAYSQAMTHNGLVYTSGQIPLSPESGQMVGANAKEQVQQVLKNLENVLQAAGAKVASIIKTTIYLTNMNDFAAVNEAYQNWVGEHRPARTCIAVAALPKNALVEIECVAGAE